MAKHDETAFAFLKRFVSKGIVFIVFLISLMVFGVCTALNTQPQVWVISGGVMFASIFQFFKK